MIACIITHSRGSLITLKRGAFVLCDTGMNIIVTYFLSHLGHITNHLVSWNLYSENSFFWIIAFCSELNVEVKINAYAHRKTFIKAQ